jgi:hypothetical protein
MQLSEAGISVVHEVYKHGLVLAVSMLHEIQYLVGAKLHPPPALRRGIIYSDVWEDWNISIYSSSLVLNTPIFGAFLGDNRSSWLLVGREGRSNCYKPIR